MKVMTDYALRRPSMDGVRAAFGSIANAVSKTKGDLPLLCFYLNNTWAIGKSDACCNVVAGEVMHEMEVAIVADAWDAQQKDRKTIAEVMRATGFGRAKARKLLIEARRI